MKKLRYYIYVLIFATIIIIVMLNRDMKVMDAYVPKNIPSTFQINEVGFSSPWEKKQYEFIDERVGAINQNIFNIKMRDFVRHENEFEIEFITRATMEIYHKTFHCNYVAMDKFTTNFSPSQTFSQGYLGLDYVPCGLCNQRAFWLASVLKNNYIESEIIGLSGHVVVLVKLQGEDKKIIFDPDYGVVGVPYEVDNLKNFRENLFKAYSHVLEYNFNKINEVVEFYLSYEDNEIWDLDSLFSLHLSQNEFLKSDVFLDQFKRDFHYELEEVVLRDESQIELLAKYINSALISNEFNQEFYFEKISEFYKS
jgi:hypothetical protein